MVTGAHAHDRARLSPETQQVLAFATDEARRLNHDYVGTEHLLLGLIRDEGSVPARALARAGAGLPKARAAVGRTFGQGTPADGGPVELSARAALALDQAMDEADHLGARAVAPEHLLLALTDEGEGVAAGVLEGMGVDPARLRRDVLQAVGPAQGAPA